MSDIHIRKTGRAGHITLNRPQALNALTYEMMGLIERALDAWRGDAQVDLVIIDAMGARAFCSGGDIADLYAAGRAGDFGFGQTFWRDEYRLNAKLAMYPKPIVTFLQGFTMGGGVGIGCHASHRIVGQSAQIAMPECAIGLIPDVGGSLMLANAPGRTGEYLGLTGQRMAAADAIYAGFADHHVPEAEWDSVKSGLIETGDVAGLAPWISAPAPGDLAGAQGEIDALFGGPTLADIAKAVAQSQTEFAAHALKSMRRNSPLSMACALDLITQVRRDPTIRSALTHEYRFTARATEHGDFLEGIRAAIIDKDRAPKWRHDLDAVRASDIDRMTASLGEMELDLEGAI